MLERRRGLLRRGRGRQERGSGTVLEPRRRWAKEAEGSPAWERRRALLVGTATTLACRGPGGPFLPKCLLKKVSIAGGWWLLAQKPGVKEAPRGSAGHGGDGGQEQGHGGELGAVMHGGAQTGTC